MQEFYVEGPAKHDGPEPGPPARTLPVAQARVTDEYRAVEEPWHVQNSRTLGGGI